VVAPSPGGSTLSRSAVLTIADFRTLELEVDVFERDIHQVREGARPAFASTPTRTSRAAAASV